MPSRADTPRDLMFGLLALQTGLIDQSALVVAFHAWTRAEGRPMAELLVEQGAIDDDQRSLLEGLAAQHLRKNGGDPERSLAALGAGPSTRVKLASIDDPDLDASLALVGSALPPDDDPYKTASRAIGTSTSGGQRFRVLRPHARGGLGEVFVALDAELNREVALKEILEDHAHDPAHQSKFLIEAEITGGLEHPGIVPVYGLGHYEDGRPFYAMRFIKGDNLKQAIAQFHANEALKDDSGARSLALRKLLRRFVDVCNAIEYAHSRGVLHRDIKPGNVIVGRHGETLVVDWGLAKARGQFDPTSTGGERNLIPASASGSAETLPGHAIGTPAYMSPEQAVGDLDRLGPRSDVYSLGATLYSLLTGRTPFEGEIGAVLQDVENGRFPRPRSLDPTIDPALEALCLKAMARSPEDRYPSPKALAEDLDRWSADQPVAAWKEPLSRRARRWARQHRTGVTAASATALALLVGLAGIVAVQSKANHDLNSKNSLLTAAIAREGRANADLKIANDEVRANNVRLVEANARESKINAELKIANERVQARFDLAQESIHTFRATVTEDQILKDEKFRPLRDRLLRSAAEFYGKLGSLLEGQNDRRSRLALANAYQGLGELTAEIGVRPEAMAVYRKELSARRELARGGEPGVVLELAECLLRVGESAQQIGDSAEASLFSKEAGRILSAEKWPPKLVDRSDALLAASHDIAAILLHSTGESARALESDRAALAIRERLARDDPDDTARQAELANSHLNIGVVLGRIGKPADSLESHRAALAIRERLARDNPAVNLFQSNLARSYSEIGSLLFITGEPARSLESQRAALAIRRRLARDNPAVTEVQASLASSLINIGIQLGRTGEPARALESYREGLAIKERLARDNPAVPQFLAELAKGHNNLGTQLGRMGEPARALESYREALAIRERLARDNPDVTQFQSELAMSHSNIGITLVGIGEPARALEAHRAALAIQGRLARDNPAVTEFQTELARSHTFIGYALAILGEPARALESHREALAILAELARDNPAVTEVHSLLATSRANVGNMLDRIGEPARALEPHREALAIRERLARANPAVTELQSNLGRSHYQIGLLLGHTREPARALESYRAALAIFEELARVNPAIPSFQRGICSSLAGVGHSLAELGRAAEAVTTLRQAVAMESRVPHDPATFYELACHQSRLAGAATLPGSGLSVDETRTEANRAVAMLRRAVASGYRRDVKAIHANKDFDVIRSRPDFQESLMDLDFPDRPFLP